MSEGKKTAYIVSHTHWDREWRYTIWATRKWLVDFIDELVPLLESGDYPGFLMDGQVAPVLDYLEIRPEMEARIRPLIASGKLLVGPWYTLPDEYPVDGEALIRNLIHGIKASEKLGKTFLSGYTPFGWGQIAQLPQIYAGFGIDIAFIGKRVNAERAPKSEFLWKGPDGSELLSTRFGDMGRQNFYFRINLQGLYGLDHQTWDWEYRYKEHGILFHRADRDRMEQDFFRIDAPADPQLETVTPDIVEKTWHSTDDSVLSDDRLMMNGCDYAAAQPLVPMMIERIRAVDPDKNRQWIHTTMPAFMDIMRKKIDRDTLPVVEGELRDGPVGFLTGNALTTRIDIKMLNKKAQNLLIRTAEPLAVMATVTGSDWPDYFLRQAWQYLLQAHPHDSINGVTQDKTTHDVINRLEQVIDLSETVIESSMQFLLQKMNLGDYSPDDFLLVVFNTLPYPRREVIETHITIPKSTPHTPAWADDLGFFQVYDSDGHALDTQWEGVEDADYCVSEVHARILPMYGKRHKLYFDTGEMPATGYKTFRLGREKDIRPDSAAWSDNQARTGSLLKSPNELENEFLRITMNPNGTFDLYDKHQDRAFSGLNYYEDRGEHGTYWINYRPMHQQTISSIGCAARIWAEENGPVQASLVSEIALQVPKRGDKGKQKRGDLVEDLNIRTKVTLKSGERQVHVNVQLENRHEDHYLRVLFPSGITEVTEADAGGHFYVDRRPIKAQGPREDSEWPDMATQPFSHFLDISDGTTGLGFITDSLTEYEVLDDSKRTVALSLLRAVKTWIVSGHVGSDYPSQKGGQVLGNHSFNYAIVPHEGNWQTAGLPEMSERVNVPVIPVQTNAHKGTLRGSGLSFFRISNPHARLAALKQSENRRSYIIRIYNTDGRAQKAELVFGVPVKAAWLTDLNEERKETIKEIAGKTIQVKMAPYKIETIEFELIE